MHEAFERFCAELRELAKTDPEQAAALIEEARERLREKFGEL
jgi:hypothetical protein